MLILCMLSCQKLDVCDTTLWYILWSISTIRTVIISKLGILKVDVFYLDILGEFQVYEKR